jgi:hypothetical protein
MSNWTTLAEVCVGNGRWPGRDFLDVTCRIERRGEKHRVTLVEQHGTGRGLADEVHHERKVIAIDTDLDAAVRIANSRAQAAGIDEGKMIQALSQAHSEAVDAEEDSAEPAAQPLRGWDPGG